MEDEEITLVQPVMETSVCYLLYDYEYETTFWVKKEDEFDEIVEEISEDQVQEYQDLFEDEEGYDYEDVWDEDEDDEE